MRVRLVNIRPNPFRNIDRYPYNEAKITALRESFQATGFWENWIGRVISSAETPEEDVVVEIAYGHHRREALRRAHGAEGGVVSPDVFVDVITKPLSDSDMLQIMARENMQEWGTNAWIEIETVRATVNAYARGQIQLLQLDERTNTSQMRDAPSFQPWNAPGTTPAHPYTASVLAPFIGWHVDKVRDTLAALELIEAGVLDDSDYASLTTSQALAATQRAQQIRAGARDRARAAEQESAEATAEAERLREREAVARREEADARRQAIEARDEQLRVHLKQNESKAREAYQAAQEAAQQAEARAAERKAEAEAERKAGAVRAGEVGRQMADQLRGGASVREVLRKPVPEPAGELTEGCQRAAGVLRRILTDSDISRLLEVLGRDPEKASFSARHDLEGALREMATASAAWANKLQAIAKADESAAEDLVGS